MSLLQNKRAFIQKLLHNQQRYIHPRFQTNPFKKISMLKSIIKQQPQENLRKMTSKLVKKWVKVSLDK